MDHLRREFNLIFLTIWYRNIFAAKSAVFSKTRKHFSRMLFWYKLCLKNDVGIVVTVTEEKDDDSQFFTMMVLSAS